MTNNDNIDLEFNSIGKRSPYRMPDGYLEHLQQGILARNIQKPKSTSLPLKRSVSLTLWSAIASAACLALVIAGSWMFFSRTPAVEYSIEDLDLCFAQLSEEDKEYLLDLYDDYDYEDYLLTQIDEFDL